MYVDILIKINGMEAIINRCRMVNDYDCSIGSVRITWYPVKSVRIRFLTDPFESVRHLETSDLSVSGLGLGMKDERAICVESIREYSRYFIKF
jgi:hypothetical protein